MAKSANGWPVLSSSSQCKVWKVPVRKGPARHLILAPHAPGFLLVHFALWFHERIEPLNDGQWDEWGWAYRPIRGQASGFSNHASGTAVDLNATKHPLGKSGTFRWAWQYTKIRARLLMYRGAIRWGGDYRSRKDEMHFELNAGKAKVLRVARRLRKTKRGRRIRAIN